MTLLALGLVLGAAVLHATWNLYSKRAGTAGPVFVWLVALCATVAWGPVALVAWVIVRPDMGPLEVTFMAGTAVLHLAYYLVLQEGYRTGDLGVVYPLARGTGPLITTVVAVSVIGERPGPVALAGALLICGGVIALGMRGRGDPRGVAFGLATGALIACYTLWDRHGVGALAIPPLIYDWTANAGRTLLMAPVAAVCREDVRRVWDAHRRSVLVVGIVSPLAYILVLTALTFTPVSYVAPAREVSILIGAALGARFLDERHTRMRLAAGAAIVAGVVCLAVG